jgi:hypothetical protein
MATKSTGAEISLKQEVIAKLPILVIPATILSGNLVLTA